MSRCFPYPPPGFEKKARSDHSDLLAKERQKEREHKKEKRDKEKKESKEKKDKDKSRDKYKEKKDRKERHKDKKRDKDKNRTPDGKRTEGPGGRNEQNVGSTFSEELGWRNKDEKGAANRMLEFTGSISKAEEVDDSRFTKELGRRMEVEKTAQASRMLENITGSIPKRVESLGASTALERGNAKPVVANFVSNGKRKAGEVSRPPEKANHHHQALHNHQGLPNGNPMVANFSKEQRKAEGVGHPAEKDNHKRPALSHRTPVVSNCISTEQRRVDEITRAAEKGSRNNQPLLQTPDRQALLQTPAEKDEVKSIERKEKGKNRKADNWHGDRSKDREREEKKNKGKDNNRDKEKEKEEEEEEEKKKRVNGENSHDTPKGRGRDHVDILKFKPLAPHNNNENFAGNYGNIKKRKEIEMNGFLHEGEVPPKKLPRSASPFHLQNGKTLEFDHIHTTYPSSIRHGSQNNIKAERLVKTEELTINGSVATQPSPADLKPLLAVDSKLSLAAVAQPSPADLQPSVAAVAQPSPTDLQPSVAAVAQPSPADLKPSVAALASSPVDLKLPLAAVAQPSPAALMSSFAPLPRSSPADVKASRAAVTQPSAAALKSSFAADASGKSKVFPKPPHPDSKFLSQIYSLPETEEWPAYDDQEWIFSSSDHQPKLKVEIEAEETPQVWARGLKIESADVFALPYVIPY